MRCTVSSIRCAPRLAKDGISVTIICPGYIRTNVTRNALTGNGTALGTMDATHEDAMPPEECARRIVDAVAKRKEELIVGGRETMGRPAEAIRSRARVPNGQDEMSDQPLGVRSKVESGRGRCRPSRRLVRRHFLTFGPDPMRPAATEKSS